VLSLEVEKARLKRANHGAARQSQNHCQKIGGVHEASCLSFKPPSKFDDLSREAGALETYVPGDLLKLRDGVLNVGATNADALMAVAESWCQFATNVWRLSRQYLAHAHSLLAAESNLGSRSQSCRTERVAETFGPDRTR
jgi:hypothetical protein